MHNGYGILLSFVELILKDTKGVNGSLNQRTDMTKGKTTNNGSQKHYTENEGLSKINKGTHRLVKQLISTGKNTSTGKGTHSVHIVTYKNVINIL